MKRDAGRRSPRDRRRDSLSVISQTEKVDCRRTDAMRREKERERGGGGKALHE